MKKVKVMSLAAVLTAAFVMAASANGLGGRPGPHGGGGRGMKRLLRNPEMVKKIGITDEQIEKLEAIQYAAEKEQVQLRADLKMAEIEMKHLMQNDSVDRAAILQASDKVAEAQQALQKAELIQMLDAKEVLTADQLKALEQAHDRRGKRGGCGSGMRDGKGKKSMGNRGCEKGRPCFEGNMNVPTDENVE